MFVSCIAGYCQFVTFSWDCGLSSLGQMALAWISPSETELLSLRGKSLFRQYEDYQMQKLVIGHSWTASVPLPCCLFLSLMKLLVGMFADPQAGTEQPSAGTGSRGRAVLALGPGSWDLCLTLWLPWWRTKTLWPSSGNTTWLCIIMAYSEEYICLCGIIYLWSLVLLPVLVTVWKFLTLQAGSDLLCSGGLGVNSGTCPSFLQVFVTGNTWQYPLQGHAPATSWGASLLPGPHVPWMGSLFMQLRDEKCICSIAFLVWTVGASGFGMHCGLPANKL